MTTLAAYKAGGKPIRGMLQGAPGTGKTGGLAVLANAGYNIRIADFDGNTDSLIPHLTDEALGRVEVVSLEDRLKDSAALKVLETDGTPTAFARFLKLWNSWKYTNADGSEVDLGPVRSWGKNDILFIDSLTEMGDAAMRRAMALGNRTKLNRRDTDWGVAMSELDDVMKVITASDIPCHIIISSHVKIVAPRTERKEDSELTKTVKEQLADLVPARLYPSALGHQLPQLIARHFPVLLIFETTFINGQAKRVIRTVPRPELDAKMPATSVPKELPLSTGMLTIFDALMGRENMPDPGAVAAILDKPKAA